MLHINFPHPDFPSWSQEFKLSFSRKSASQSFRLPSTPEIESGMEMKMGEKRWSGETDMET